MDEVKQDSSSAGSPRPRAVSLDALGTLVELEAPWKHLAAALGVEPDAGLVAAFREEMAYYRDHSHLARDAASLAELRARCAAILGGALAREVSVETMMDAIRFRTYPDSKPALRELRRMGLALVCVSNWDCSLPDVLAGCGLARAFEAVVTSAGAGARKPDPAIFADALEACRCGPGEMIHVGDTAAEDVVGARAAGIEPILLDRAGGGDISSLAELPGRVAKMLRP